VHYALLVTLSILPVDKTFNCPLFLTLVHHSTSLDGLKRGLEHLTKVIDEKWEAREQLVRTHFGLFVSCSDRLEELRNFRPRQGALIHVRFRSPATQMERTALLSKTGVDRPRG
jgi:hypothetical protein